VKGLSHVEINVSDFKRSIKFWGGFLKILGYAPYQKWGEGQSWRLGETYLVFVQAEKKYLGASYHRKRIGLNHLAFHASKRQFQETKSFLKKKNIPLLYKEKNINSKLLFFEDPDRIKVELVIS
jgi:catechol 2,3-dioxygenase-like lactoylglutathione lyase family enzyme